MRKFRIEFLLSAVVEVDEDLPKDELMGQLYHALDLNKYKFNGFEVTNFRGESNVIKDEEVNDDIDEEKEHPEKPIPLALFDSAIINVLIPITSPDKFISGPPLFPGFMEASV